MQESSSTLTALAVVARHYGIDVRSEELRRNFALENGEPSGEQLAAIGRDLHLEIKPMHLSWGDLPKLRRVLPAILRLKEGGALLLDAVNHDKKTGQVAVVRDPHHGADAQAAIDEAQLAQVWSGEVVLVKRHYAFGDEERPFGVTWLAARLLGEKKLFRDIAFSAIINILFILTPPIVARVVIDKVMENHSTATLIALGIFFGVILIFEMILIYLRSLFLEAIAARVDGRLNLYIMEKLVRLPIEYFERNSVGRITAKLFSTWHIRYFLTGQLFLTVIDLVTALVLIPILFVISWELALLVMAWGTIVFLIVLAFLRPLQRRHHLVIGAENEKAAYLTETIYGMRTIKSLALEGRRRMEWDPRVAKALSYRFDLGMLAHHMQTMTQPFERLVTSGSMIAGAAIYVYYEQMMYQTSTSTTMGLSKGAAAVGMQTAGAAASIASQMHPGLLVSFVILAGSAVSPLMRVAKLVLEISEVRAAIAQVASIVNNPQEETRAGTGLRLPIRGNIAFQNVRFRYSASAPLALDNVSFTVPPGTVLGIMGRSGSGKTTVTRLLQGLNPNYEGVIKVDSMDLREMDLQYLRTNIGVVAQENFLFSGTIRENIGMARPDASMAEIVRAAQLAGAEEFIERLPRGYNTELAEGATNLSGGQRQRIAIARALLLDPAVLILDEATSALDAESEAIINANLRRIADGRSIICVSHRLSMLVSANAILVLEKGKVYDIGTHAELLQRCDIYRHMWYEQNRHIEATASHGPITIVQAAQG